MQTNLRNVLMAIALLAPSSASADVITEWSQKATTFVSARLGTAPAERVMAMVHVAMFDAVNSIDRRYRPYLVQLPAKPGTSQEAAAATAAGTVLASLHPQAEGELKGAMATYLAAIPNGEAKADGMRLGEEVAARLLAARANDGAAATDSYRPKAKPGVYVPTAMPQSTTWPNVKPFALATGSQFRPVPPVSLTSERWAADLNEVKQLGSRNSSKRSARQTEDARFWLAGGPVIYYPVVWQLAAAKTETIVDRARFMALIAVARADALVAVFDAKYHYDFWRPVTAIRNGDIDDNPATEREAAWQPIADTPMHPEYPCAHCILSATIASVTENLFGTATVPEITLTSPTAPGVTHRWTSVWSYAREAAEARIAAGFHYRFSADVGQDMGRKIGTYVVQHVMQPVATAQSR